MLIRREEPDDHETIRALLEAAFPDGGFEARLVDELRAGDDLVPELCLVAIESGRLVGSVHFSRAFLPSGHEILALAPVAVLPGHQRQGIGTRLIRDALDRAAATSFGLVVLLGHAAYYPRFGFVPAAARGIEAPWDVPSGSWMMLPLPAYDPAARGVVRFAAAFDSAL